MLARTAILEDYFAAAESTALPSRRFKNSDHWLISEIQNKPFKNIILLILMPQEDIGTGCVSQFFKYVFERIFLRGFSRNLKSPFFSSDRISLLNILLFTSLFFNNSSAISSPLFSFHHRRKGFSN